MKATGTHGLVGQGIGHVHSNGDGEHDGTLTDQRYWENIWQQQKAQSEAVRDFRDPKRYGSVVLDDIFRRRFARNPGHRFIEVGCGSGQMLVMFHRTFGYSVTGCDYSEASCNLTRRHLDAAGVPGTILQQDFFTLTGSYEVVFSGGLIEHFTDPKLVLEKFVSLLAPGGTLVSMVPNLAGLSGLYHRLWKPETFTTHRVVTLTEMDRWYRDLGLRNIETGAVGSVVPTRFPHEQIRITHPHIYPLFLNAFFRPLAWGTNRACLLAYRRFGLRFESPRFSPRLYAIGDKP